MYRANRRYRKHATFLRFVLVVLPLLLIIALFVWWFFLKSDESSSTNFEKIGTRRIESTPTKVFTTPFYKVTLPATWKDNGRKNPFSDEVYYEYQNTQKNYENQWLRIYVDTFRRDLPINRILPVTVSNNQIIPGAISDDCTSFTDAPKNSQNAANWAAKWQGVSFVCDIASAENTTGTVSPDEGYSLTLTGSKGSHEYFFAYTDFNIRPNFQLLSDALKSFEPL